MPQGGFDIVNHKLVVLCVEGVAPNCSGAVEISLPVTGESLHYALKDAGWYDSILTAPGQGDKVPILHGALCGFCAPRFYTPELLAAANKAMGR